MFEFADEAPKEIQYGSLTNLPKLFPDIFTAFQMLLLLGWARRRLFISLFCCYAAFISASTPGHTYQLCALRGRLERGASLVAVSMMSALSGARILMQVPSGIVRNLESKVQISHPPPVGYRLRRFLGTAILPSVRCGPEWDVDLLCVYKVMIPSYTLAVIDPNPFSSTNPRLFPYFPLSLSPFVSSV